MLASLNLQRTAWNFGETNFTRILLRHFKRISETYFPFCLFIYYLSMYFISQKRVSPHWMWLLPPARCHPWARQVLIQEQHGTVSIASHFINPLEQRKSLKRWCFFLLSWKIHFSPVKSRSLFFNSVLLEASNGPPTQAGLLWNTEAHSPSTTRMTSRKKCLLCRG